MKPAAFLLLTSLLFSSCTFEPESDQRLTPLPEYRQWWQEVEVCSKRHANYDAVSWFVLEPGDQTRGNGASYAGYAKGKTIWLLERFASHEPTVKHEMLHVISGEYNHNGNVWIQCKLRPEDIFPS